MRKLPALEQKIKEGIEQVENNIHTYIHTCIHPSHNPIYTEKLNIEIEMLDWALNEITAL